MYENFKDCFGSLKKQKAKKEASMARTIRHQKGDAERKESAPRRKASRRHDKKEHEGKKGVGPSWIERIFYLYD